MASSEVLDVCCGGRMWWWDKNHPLATYVDNRQLPKGTMEEHPNWECQPDIVADFRSLPFADAQYNLVLFDPPQLLRLDDANIAHGFMAVKYGHLDRATAHEDIALGFEECWRVLKPGGTLIFKWSGNRKWVEDCYPAEPIVGTRRAKGTQWLVFYKPAA